MPDKDELDEALQENLKLRHELGEKIAKAKHIGGWAYRLGWVLYWTCLALAALSALIAVAALLTELWVISQSEFSRDHILGGALSAMILYGVGRAFRYVLSWE
jgi:hypothetical protein